MEWWLTSDSGTRPQPNHYRWDIQGLRGLAVSMVVAFHVGLPIPGGFFGVDVFFVVSGFVIATILLRELKEKERLDFRAFYTRRARRLLPALALVIATVSMAGIFFLSPLGQQEQTARVGVAASMFLANLELYRLPAGYFDLSAQHNPFLHTWSLSVEEQFYLAFPVLLVFLWRITRRVGKRSSARSLLPGSLMLVGTMSLLLWLPFLGKGSEKLVFYSPVTRAWEFLLGALVASVNPTLLRASRLVSFFSGITGLILVVYAATKAHIHPISPLAAVLPVVGAGLLIAAGSTTLTTSVTRLLSIRPLTWLGDLSYSWYLWHWPILIFGRMLLPHRNLWALSLLGLAALIPSWISFRWVESPIRSNTTLCGRRLIPFLAVCILVPIATSLFLQFNPLLLVHNIKETKQQHRNHADLDRRCQGLLPSQDRSLSRCTWTVPNASGSVILLGDSNAGQFTEPAAKAANEHGLNLTVATLGRCPFVDLVVQFASSDVDADKCHRFVRQWIEAVPKLRPHLVFIASSSTEYLHPASGVRLKNPKTGDFEEKPDSRALLWEEGLARILRRWQPQVQTVVMHTVPHFSSFDLANCPAIHLLMNPGRCSQSLSLQKVREEQQLALQAEQNALGQVPSAFGIDFTTQLCSRQICSTHRGRDLLFRDGSHLSVEGALSLSGTFTKLICMPPDGSQPAERLCDTNPRASRK